ncbi:hypothetical protein FB446DRAFT_771332 [Lentinula raphanica]|nr:hypothetical protein FB446DRAFT_771332 [Lentinula raphanica]
MLLPRSILIFTFWSINLLGCFTLPLRFSSSEMPERARRAAVKEYEETGNQLTDLQSTGFQLGEGAYSVRNLGDWRGRFVCEVSADLNKIRATQRGGKEEDIREETKEERQEEKQEEKKVQEDTIPSKDEIPPRGIIRKNPRKRNFNNFEQEWKIVKRNMETLERIEIIYDT